MRQILQDLGSGTTNIMEAPCVAASPGTIVSTTRATLISAGQSDAGRETFGRARKPGLRPAFGRQGS